MAQQPFNYAPIANPVPVTEPKYAPDSSTPVANAVPITESKYAPDSSATVANPVPGTEPQYVPNSCAPVANPVPVTEPQYANPYARVLVANPIPIIGPQYCSPYAVDLAITRKVLTITDGDFVVTDVNGNFMFKVKGKLFSLHDRRVILDAADKPIVNLRQRIMTMHNRWEVFRGEGSEEKDLIFTAKQSSIIQLKTKLDVFLAHNKAQEVCDYKVKGSWTEKSCIVYAGESSSIVAQMHKKITVQSELFGKDKFMVTVYPNIDFAFIVALIVILDDTNASDE